MIRSFSRGLALAAGLVLLSACGGANDDSQPNVPGNTDTTAPTLSVSPADGASIAPDATLVLTFSESMDMPSLRFGGVIGETPLKATWDGDKVVTIKPNAGWPENTDASFSIDGKDLAGNAMTTVTVEYRIKDATPPTAEISPADGESILPDAVITVNFSEAMDRDSLALEGTLADEAKDPQWSDDNMSFTLSPAIEWTQGAERSITINAKDAGGNAMQALSANFHVKDMSQPQVIALSPATDVLGKTEALVISFNKPMNPDSLTVSGSLDAQNATAEWSTTTFENDTLTLTPKTGWPAGMKRELILDIADIYGLDLAQYTEDFLVLMQFDDGQSAETVIGQADGTAFALNAISANTLHTPTGNIWVSEDGRLFIGDTGNNRVLGYDSIPAAHGAAADFVLGQTNFAAAADGATNTQYENPYQIFGSESDNLFVVSDYTNGRVAIYNGIPGTGGEVISRLAGKDDFGSTVAFCTQTSTATVSSAIIANGKLIAADETHHRLLIWNTIPATSGEPADVVIGQSKFDACAQADDNQDGMYDGMPSARTLRAPAGIWSDGTRLVVADKDSNRVLIWNSIPTSNFQPADRVLGQADFDDWFPNNGAMPSEKNLREPIAVWSNGVQLFVADSGNHRVLIWNSWPAADFQPADNVLGQPDFDQGQPNDVDGNGLPDDATAGLHTLNKPAGVFAHEDKLFISDSNNNRVLIYKSK